MDTSAHAHTHTNTYRAIDQMIRLFASGLGDWGLIPGRVIPKIQKWY